MKELLSGVVIFIAVALLIALIVAFPTMWLWNAVVPDIFGLPHIGAWQALWLNLLCHFLFKGSKGGDSK